MLISYQISCCNISKKIKYYLYMVFKILKSELLNVHVFQFKYCSGS